MRHRVSKQAPDALWEPLPQAGSRPEDGAFRVQDARGQGISQFAGAPAATKAPEAGRFAAEWSPGRAEVRRNSELRTRRRAGGGVMAAADDAVPGARVKPERVQRRPRRGAGGRWLVWAMRAVVWAVLLVIGYRGVAAIVTGPSQASPAATVPAARSSGGFPAGLAGAFALQFGNVYLNFSPATATRRAGELSAFLPPGTDPQLGWNGAGSQRLQSEQVASVAVQDSHHAVVTLLALVSGHLMQLGVPVYAGRGGVVVSGEPALLPPPARVSPPQPQGTASDPATEAALTSQLPAFFQAYATGDKTTLARFLAPAAHVTGLGSAVTFSSISQLEVPAGGATRHVTVTVVWHLASQAAASSSDATSGVSAAPASLEMTYEMTVVQQGGSWYVRAIGASTQLPGPP
jgi:hypothetical protein